MLLRIFPNETNFKFIKYHHFTYALSIAAIIGSAVLFVVNGLNFGIDFRGGTMIEMTTGEKAVDEGQIRDIVGGLDLGEVKVQRYGGTVNDFLIVVAQQDVPGGTPEEKEEANNAVADKVKAALAEALGEGTTFRRTEVVGPTVSAELVETAALAVFLAVLMMLIYIWFRFEWQFSLGAVLALVHDVYLTIGIFSLLQLEFNLSIIAALLTIVGYSMNDTVVVYDRVRENLRKFKRMELPALLDKSINMTLSRTVVTSLTTLLALFSLYFFGGEVIRGFTFAMIWGVVIGTYSSIFIASPLLLVTGVKRDWSGIENKPASVKA